MEAAPDSAGAKSRLKLPRGGDGNGEDFVQARNGQQTCRQVQRGRPSRRRGLQPADRDDRPRRQAPADAGAGTPMGARLAPRQAPSVIGAPPRRALFGFQGAPGSGGGGRTRGRGHALRPYGQRWMRAARLRKVCRRHVRPFAPASVGRVGGAPSRKAPSLEAAARPPAPARLPCRTGSR